jgi:very-short-patch-repair endonuclease
MSKYRKPTAAVSLSPSGERVRVRGQRRTRTAAAREFARHLRCESTDSEKSLWRLLRNRRFEQFKFRRQYPCGIYFLDFFCVGAARLAVELDGGGHGFPDQRARDEERNSFLAAQGIQVLRFWNHKLRQEQESVRFEIWNALMERTGQSKKVADLLPRTKTPHLNPLPSEGRGRGLRARPPQTYGHPSL